MNKIKKEFEKVKLSENAKIELYNNILNKTKKRNSFIPKLINAFAIVVLIFIIGIGGVYAASRIFGFDFNFLNVFGYNEEELVDKGIESEVVDLSVIDGDKKLEITNIIFDGNKIDLFIDLTNINGNWFGLLKDEKSIVKSSVVTNLSSLENGTKKGENIESIMISFEVDRELNDGDIVTLVYNGSPMTSSKTESDKNLKIDIKLNGTITKKLHIKTTGAKFEKDKKEYNIYDVKVSPMSVTVSIECSPDFYNLEFDVNETIYNVFIGTKEREYKATSYPIIIEKIDNTHAKILYDIEYHDEFINPDDVTYVRVYNYKINRNGSVENIGNSRYVEYEQKKEINDKGVYMYIGDSPLLDIAKSLSYTGDIQTYVGLYDKNIVKLYNNGKLVNKINLDEVEYSNLELANLYYDAISLKK